MKKFFCVMLVLIMTVMVTITICVAVNVKKDTECERYAIFFGEAKEGYFTALTAAETADAGNSKKLFVLVYDNQNNGACNEKFRWRWARNMDYWLDNYPAIFDCTYDYHHRPDWDLLQLEVFDGDVYRPCASQIVVFEAGLKGDFILSEDEIFHAHKDGQVSLNLEYSSTLTVKAKDGDVKISIDMEPGRSTLNGLQIGDIIQIVAKNGMATSYPATYYVNFADFGYGKE